MRGKLKGTGNSIESKSSKDGLFFMGKFRVLIYVLKSADRIQYIKFKRTEETNMKSAKLKDKIYESGLVVEENKCLMKLS